MYQHSYTSHEGFLNLSYLVILHLQISLSRCLNTVAKYNDKDTPLQATTTQFIAEAGRQESVEHTVCLEAFLGLVFPAR